jgi:hypothetical protein
VVVLQTGRKLGEGKKWMGGKADRLVRTCHCHELTMSSSPTQSSCHNLPSFNLSMAGGLIIDIHGYMQGMTVSLSEPGPDSLIVVTLP